MRAALSRRTFTALMALGLAMPALAAPSPRRRTVALLFDSLVSPFWVASIAAMRAKAAARGWDVLEGVSNLDDNRQYSQVQSMLQRGVDGIIIVHTDAKAVIPAIRAANAAGVPMVHFNRAPAESDAYSVAVVADNRTLMRQTVETLLAEARRNGSTSKAAILIGDLGDANAVARRAGFEDAVARNKDIVEVVARIATDWNADKAFAGLVNALQAHPEINLLVTSSDFLTPQIEQALKSAGKWHPAGHPDHVRIAGFDGDSEGYAKLASGHYDVDGVQDLDHEVDLSFAALEAMWAGKRPAKLQVDPGFVARREQLAADRSRIWGYSAKRALEASSAAPGGAEGVAAAGFRWSAVAAAALTLLAALVSRQGLGDIGVTLLPLLILVFGQLVVMLIGEIDLSMPAVLGLASIFSAALMTQGLGGAGEVSATLAGIACCLAVGLGIGIFNGICVAYARMPSFIVTLAVMMGGNGAALWFASHVSESISIGGLPTTFRAIGFGGAFGIPYALLVAIGAAAAVHIVLSRSLAGRWLYAIGHNRVAARFAGVPTRGVTIAAFATSGLLAGVAALLLTSRIETGQPTLGANLLLDIVGAAVIGGISLFGGRGSIWMALIGALFLTVLDKSLQLLGLSLFVVSAFKGMAILIAAALDARRRGGDAVA